MRGVYHELGAVGFADAGSSPHARGLPRRCPGVQPRFRIIPACAGFTPVDSPGDFGYEDHPRMRGVYPPPTPPSASPCGSSPHARGLRALLLVLRLGPGIIPACAGFTGARVRGTCSVSDHPRMRGVYSAVVSCGPSAVGSSPHARGLPRPVHHEDSLGRIIPACAGFTGPACLYTMDIKDHPRMRGVYTWRSLESQRSWSLPPPGFLHC